MNSEEKKKSYLDFIIPLVFSLLILVADKYHFLSPVKKVTDFFVIPMKKAVYPIRKKEEDLMGTLGFYQKLDDYKIITEKLKKYEIILAEKRSLTAENEALRKQLEAPLPPELRLIPSRVLGVRRFMHIDKGEDDGVKKGLYVVSEKAYVGKIIDITPHTAQIELPFDPDTKIAAKTSRSTHGLVGGEFGNQTVLTNVLQKDELFLDGTPFHVRLFG